MARAADLDALALSGYGHFTTMRVVRGRTRGLDLHLRRLADDCTVLFGVELDLDEVRARLHAAVDGAEDVVARVTVRDPQWTADAMPDPARPEVVVTLRAPPPTVGEPWSLRSARLDRDLPHVKHTSLLGVLHARREARRAGYDDAVLRDAGGRLTEGPTWTLGFLGPDGGLVWPAGARLAGITERLLVAATGSTEVRPITVDDVPDMRAAFATNAVRGVVPIGAIDDHRLVTPTAALAALDAAHDNLPWDPL